MPRIKLKEVRERWNAESPDFFKKLTNASVWVSLIGGILCIFPPLIPIGGTITSIGIGMGTVSKLTKKDMSLEDVEKLKSELETLKSKLN